jgi:hypothetical protein
MHVEGEERGTDAIGAIGDSLKLLMLEHGIRIALQPKTRRELGGPFIADYRRSVRWPEQWGDTDGWLVNYWGHPIHGAGRTHLAGPWSQLETACSGPSVLGPRARSRHSAPAACSSKLGC